MNIPPFFFCFFFLPLIQNQATYTHTHIYIYILFGILVAHLSIDNRLASTKPISALNH